MYAEEVAWYGYEGNCVDVNACMCVCMEAAINSCTCCHISCSIAYMYVHAVEAGNTYSVGLANPN